MTQKQASKPEGKGILPAEKRDKVWQVDIRMENFGSEWKSMD